MRYTGGGSYTGQVYALDLQSSENSYKLLDPHTLKPVSDFLMGHKSIRPLSEEEETSIRKLPATEKYHYGDYIVFRNEEVSDNTPTVYQVTKLHVKNGTIELTDISTGELLKKPDDDQEKPSLLAVELRLATSHEVEQAKKYKVSQPDPKTPVEPLKTTPKKTPLENHPNGETSETFGIAAIHSVDKFLKDLAEVQRRLAIQSQNSDDLAKRLQGITLAQRIASEANRAAHNTQGVTEDLGKIVAELGNNWKNIIRPVVLDQATSQSKTHTDAEGITPKSE